MSKTTKQIFFELYKMQSRKLEIASHTTCQINIAKTLAAIMHWFA